MSLGTGLLQGGQMMLDHAFCGAFSKGLHRSCTLRRLTVLTGVRKVARFLLDLKPPKP